MNDPYQVLGVSRNASEEEIKSAYKALVRKYHPDQYQDNPLSEFAEEKMAEINTAYDAIMNERRNGTRSGSTFNYGSGSSYTGGIDYAAIRRMIASGNITEAEQQLDQVAEGDRNAEWFFLRGNIAYSRGWLEEAYNCFAQAAQMDPYNQEYSAAYNRMNAQKGGYMAGGPTRAQRSDMDNACDCLSTLCIMDCCCECMGGDLIHCI